VLVACNSHGVCEIPLCATAHDICFCVRCGLLALGLRSVADAHELLRARSGFHSAIACHIADLMMGSSASSFVAVSVMKTALTTWTLALVALRRALSAFLHACQHVPTPVTVICRWRHAPSPTLGAEVVRQGLGAAVHLHRQALAQATVHSPPAVVMSTSAARCTR